MKPGPFALALLALSLCAGPARADGDWRACAQAGEKAEQRYGIPDGLLRAIGLVESGRSGPDGRSPWPWTIDAAGQPIFVDSRDQAVATVESRRTAGVASIDVGCFQVSLLYHPAAFGSLAEAFEPDTNADYAARFLVALRAREGSWEAAVAAYHSAAPERGLPYRDRVFAAWNGKLPESAAPPVEPVVAFGIRVVVPGRPGSAPRVIALQPAPAIPVRVNGRS